MNEPELQQQLSKVGREWLITTRALAKALVDLRLATAGAMADTAAVQIVAHLAGNAPPVLFSVELEEDAANPPVCPQCGIDWQSDSQQFGCWSCGFEQQSEAV